MEQVLKICCDQIAYDLAPNAAISVMGLTTDFPAAI